MKDGVKMKKKKKVVNVISKIIYGILLLLSVFAIVIVLDLKILPFKYVLIGALVYLPIVLLFGVFLLKKNIKIKVKIVINIFCLILSAFFGFGLYYLNNTLHFMNKIQADEYQTDEYYVLVLDDSSYKSLNDLNGKTLGFYKGGSDNYQKALNEINDKANLTNKEYSSYIEAGNALINKKVESILISSAYKSILEDFITDFETKTRIVDTVSLKLKNEVEVDNIDVSKDSFNIYISGIDIYGGISLVSRSDVNMVVTVNPTTNKVLLTSIPRDYYVRLHGTTGYKDKLTHAGIYGINMSVTTLEDLLDIDINYYIRVNFTTLISMVDAIGGITVNSDTAFTAYTNKNCSYKVGINNLDGACALAYSRERHAYKEGDRHRVQNQQDVLKAIITKSLSSKTLITKYTKILESLGNSFETNMPSDKIYSLVNKQLDSMPSWNINTISLNGSDSSNYTYSYSASKLYVMEPDVNTINTAKANIASIINGG